MMFFSTSYFAFLRIASIRWMGLITLLCVATMLSGCQSQGAVVATDTIQSYSSVLEKDERLLFSAKTAFVSGTYMEGEMELFPSYDGVLLMTSERILFVSWNDQQRSFEPAFWTSYPDIAQVKKHNNILLQYIALVAKDGSKFTFMLNTDSVDQAYSILIERIRKIHHGPKPAGTDI